MAWQSEILLPQCPRGITDITGLIQNNLPELPVCGLLNIFLKHTSAALIINENADPSVKTDFERFMNKLVSEDFLGFTHVSEGSDDMPAHIKSSLFGQTLTIPISNGRLALGTWQGIFLYEFRRNGGRRRVVLTVFS